MKLTDKRRRETGAYYTPKKWAELAVKYIKDEVGCIENFVFYDPACGEGALLEALPKGIEKYGSTMESEDVEICQKKGFSVWKMDFLEEKIDFLPEPDNEDISNIFPQEKRDRLIVFTNPPYFKLKKEQYSAMKKRYNTNDSVALFYYRILKELKPLYLCGFNKMDLYQSGSMRKFRADTDLYYRTRKQFLTPSFSWNLKGRFAIAFNIIF